MSSAAGLHTVKGSHEFLVTGYSLANGMGVGKHPSSEKFWVGGYAWAIYFYPDGKTSENDSSHVSVFITLASAGPEVRAIFEITLLDPGLNAKHKVHSHFGRILENGPYTLKYRGSMWGYKRFFKRTELESSRFLNDDCLKIKCTVGVLVPAIGSATIPVPPQCEPGLLVPLLDSDVTFIVAGERFKVPKFAEQFYGGMEDNEIVVDDMEPKVFKALRHFFYTDTLEDEELLESSSSSSVPSLSDVLAAKLFAAADRYGLDRLRLVCESAICKYISVDSVADILTLAHHYSAIQLKSVCLKFAADNLAVVKETERFKLLSELLLLELLDTIAARET